MFCAQEPAWSIVDDAKDGERLSSKKEKSVPLADTGSVKDMSATESSAVAVAAQAR